MDAPTILVTGANGQLGKALQALSGTFPEFTFLFTGREELRVDDPLQLKAYFLKWKPNWCINCAAYTAVDKAETEKEMAFQVNANAVGQLARTCVETNTRLIHISTDYIFDGTSSTPYTENSRAKPVSIYGLSKLKGEALCLLHDPASIIIRTAWVYSAVGHNFVNTMLRLMREKTQIAVVNDQIGSPTYAADLSAALIHIIRFNNWIPGIYHYTNSGKTSWYEFALAIKDVTKSNCEVKPISTSNYPTPAKRPAFSLLDTNKIRQTFGLVIPAWEESLVKCMGEIEIEK